MTITLATLKKMSAVVSIRRLALAVGMHPITLRARMKREAPELTMDESARILAILQKSTLTTYEPIPKAKK